MKSRHSFAQPHPLTYIPYIQFPHQTLDSSADKFSNFDPSSPCRPLGASTYPHHCRSTRRTVDDTHLPVTPGTSHNNCELGKGARSRMRICENSSTHPEYDERSTARSPKNPKRQSPCGHTPWNATGFKPPRTPACLRALIGENEDPITLMEQIILTSPGKRCKLRKIYTIFLRKFPILRYTAGWKGFIRYNLTHKAQFVKEGVGVRNLDGPGAYWHVKISRKENSSLHSNSLPTPSSETDAHPPAFPPALSDATQTINTVSSRESQSITSTDRGISFIDRIMENERVLPGFSGMPRLLSAEQIQRVFGGPVVSDALQPPIKVTGSAAERGYFQSDPLISVLRSGRECPFNPPQLPALASHVKMPSHPANI